MALATKNLSLPSQGFRLPRLDGNNRAASEVSTGPQWRIGFGEEMAQNPVMFLRAVLFGFLMASLAWAREAVELWVFWVFRGDDLAGSWVSASRGGPAFAEILRKEEELSRDARGVGLLRLHSSLRSVPLLLGHFRAHGNGAREVECCEFSGFSGGMIRRGRGRASRWVR